MVICFMLSGTYPTHEFSGTTSTSHECSVFETKSGDDEFSVQEFYIPKAPGFEVNTKYGGNLEDDTFSSLSRLPVEKSSEARVEVGVDVTEKIDQPVTKLDVEAVLEKQETHDLYCPNCNSCITRRIILRRRKRKVRNLHLKPKHDKYETVLGSDLVTNPANAANQDHDANNISSGSPTRVDDGYTTNREVDIFRCLSCFSIFIPSGNFTLSPWETFSLPSNLFAMMDLDITFRILKYTCFVDGALIMEKN